MTVVCGAGCGWAVHTHAQVQQDIGKPQHIGVRRKALDKTSQTITLNIGKSVGFNNLTAKSVLAGEKLVATYSISM